MNLNELNPLTTSTPESCKSVSSEIFINVYRVEVLHLNNSYELE